MTDYAALAKERKRIFDLNLEFIIEHAKPLLRKGYIPVHTTTGRRYGSEPLYLHLAPRNAKVVFTDIDEWHRKREENPSYPYDIEPPPKQAEFHYIEEDGRLCGPDGHVLFDENKNDIYADKEEYYSFFPWLRPDEKENQ